MNEKASAVIEIQYAVSKDGGKRVPISVCVTEGSEVLYSSAIYASDRLYDIPGCMKEACKNAPCLSGVKQQLKDFDVPVFI